MPYYDRYHNPGRYGISYHGLLPGNCHEYGRRGRQRHDYYSRYIGNDTTTTTDRTQQLRMVFEAIQAYYVETNVINCSIPISACGQGPQ